MKKNFDKALRKVLIYEKGFVNHPSDKGGATNKGITIGTLQRFNKEFDYGDFDQDGDVDIDDVKLLNTAEKAAPIYEKYFWDILHLDNYPSKIDFLMFDFAVNSGPGNASKILQRSLKVKDDGIIGSVTMAALQKMDPFFLSELMLSERKRFYDKLVARHPDQMIFYNGWMNRINKLREDIKEVDKSLDRTEDMDLIDLLMKKEMYEADV